MKAIFLGTGGTHPTPSRNVTAHVVWVKGETLLFDCGEATQRQLRRSSARFNVHRIFLSHLHLDHILGLPGYLGTLQILGRTEPLRIYVPVGARPYVHALAGLAGQPQFSLEIEELDDGAVVKGEGFRVTAARVEHAGMCLGFRVEEDERPGRVDVERARQLGIEPGPRLGQLLDAGSLEVGGRVVRAEEIAGPRRRGRCVVYSGDTRPCPAIVKLARGADLLIHEATYSNEFRDEAIARAHSTAADAARMAADAKVRRLALSHISPRHQLPASPAPLLVEAQAVFPGAILPNDLDELEVPLTD